MVKILFIGFLFATPPSPVAIDPKFEVVKKTEANLGRIEIETFQERHLKIGRVDKQL